MVTARHSPPIRSSRWDIATSRPWLVDSATGSRSAATSRVERILTHGGTVTSIDALLQLPDVLRLRAALAGRPGVAITTDDSPRRLAAIARVPRPGAGHAPTGDP